MVIHFSKGYLKLGFVILIISLGQVQQQSLYFPLVIAQNYNFVSMHQNNLYYFSSKFVGFFSKELSISVICFVALILPPAFPDHLSRLYNSISILIPFINSVFIAFYYFITPCFKEYTFYLGQFLRE